MVCFSYDIKVTITFDMGQLGLLYFTTNLLQLMHRDAYAFTMTFFIFYNLCIYNI